MTHRILALAPLALAAPAFAGDDAPPAPASTVTALEDGSFRFESVAEVPAPAGAVWAKVKNIEADVAIALPGIAEDFTWLDGGSPGHVPSDFQFVALGATVHEQVFFRDHDAKILQYQLVEPALGLQSYVGTMQVVPVDADTSVLVFSRDIRFDDPASADSFAGLFEQEIAYLQDYFTR